MPWAGEQRGFVIKIFFKNTVYVTAMQKAFYTQLGHIYTFLAQSINKICIARLLKTLEQYTNGLFTVPKSLFGVVCP